MSGTRRTEAAPVRAPSIARTRIGKSGHNLFVRIPRRLAREVGVERGDAFVIRPEGRNRLVVEFEAREAAEL